MPDKVLPYPAYYTKLYLGAWSPLSPYGVRSMIPSLCLHTQDGLCGTDGHSTSAAYVWLDKEQRDIISHTRKQHANPHIVVK